jgi:hypothetical protein
MTSEETDALVALLNAQLEHGSDKEKDARRAVARIVRAAVSHLLHTNKEREIDTSVLDMLADLVDPDCSRCPGYIRFEQRREGRPSDVLRDQEIVEFIEQRRYGAKHGEMESIINEAAKKSGLSERRVWMIWRSR